MDELASIMNSVARLLAIVAGGVSVVAFCYAGILWMTASGDPGKMGQARAALMGAIGGLIIVGIAFIVPRVISQVVIEPVGGVALQSDTGVDCDTVLRQQLIFQRAASTAEKMDAVVAQIQSQRSECQSDVWDPDIADAHTPTGVTTAEAAGTAAYDGTTGSCFGTTPTTDTAIRGLSVGQDQLVPRGLRDENSEDQLVRDSSGRDSDNNIIIYWGTVDKRPADNATCWLYVSRLRTWSENY